MSSLTEHLDVLYPLARILAGPEEAETLLQRVYERAARVPPEDRPDDQHAWLSGLVIDTLEGPFLPGSSTGEHSDTSSFSKDPFRQKVARQTAERALPVAFAACSLHERFLLALDVLGNPSDQGLASALGTSPEDARLMRDEARSALRAALRDVLTGPERMLVDVALPEDAIQDSLHTLLTEHYQPVPLALRSKVNDTLQNARAERNGEGKIRGLPRRVLSSLAARIPTEFASRRAFLALLFLVVISAGLFGLFSLLQPTAESSPSLVDLSARQANSIRPQLESSDPTELETYVQQTWNRRVSVPTIEQAQLQGIGRFHVTDEVEVPVFLYSDSADSSRLAAFAYSYALLDRLGPQTALDANLRSQLAKNEEMLERQTEDRGVVLWRHRDDIFIAVSPSHDSARLHDRIQP